MKDLMVAKIKKDGKEQVNEVHGWSADRDDFNIVGGNIDPKKQYSVVKLWSGSGYLLNLFITEYHDSLEDMVMDIYNEFGESHKACFPTLDQYYDAVATWKEDLIKDRDEKKFTWTKEGDDDDRIEMMAEEFAEESILPMWDYDGDVCIWAENAFFSKPMSGEKVEEELSKL